jgi:2-keto-3-deoxy-L-rhamnonate aldolase RhmA
VPRVHPGADWICIDTQHGAVTYDSLNYMLCATSSHKAKRIVRVGGPDGELRRQDAAGVGAGLFPPSMLTPPVLSTPCMVHAARTHADRYGMQQALDLGADGVMVPLVNTKRDAEQAVSYCLFPPQGQRSAAYPVRCARRP